MFLFVNKRSCTVFLLLTFYYSCYTVHCNLEVPNWFLFASGLGFPLYTESFTISHNDPAAHQDHCGSGEMPNSPIEQDIFLRILNPIFWLVYKNSVHSCYGSLNTKKYNFPIFPIISSSYFKTKLMVRNFDTFEYLLQIFVQFSQGVDFPW